MPQLAYSICPKKYVLNERNKGFQLNAIPIYNQGGAFEIYFPRPFQILGLFQQPTNMPATALAIPSFPRSYFALETPANQNTYKDLTVTLMIELAMASRQELDPTGLLNTVEYLATGPQGTDYRGYFTRQLNDTAILEPRQYLNTFLQPANRFYQFAALNSATAAVDWEIRYRELVSFIQQTSEPNLYGAPGSYYLLDSPTAEVELSGESIYEEVDEG